MNCENFNDRLPDYLDETLSAAEQAGAREHVQKCSACQRALARQEAFAKSIRLSLDRKTQGLTLRPETRQNILNALEPRGVLPTARQYLRAFIEIFWRQPAWTGAFLLCLLVIMSGNHFYRHSMNSAVKGERENYVINVPIQSEMCVYRRQNNLVVDAVVTGTSVADANFSENATPSASSKPHIN